MEAEKEGADEEDSRPIIIHNGTSRIRAGFADDEAPRGFFPTVVGHPRMMGMAWSHMAHGNEQLNMGRGVLVGHEAISKRGLLSLVHNIIQTGIIHKWDEMEDLWHHTFYNELRVAPEDHPVMLTEVPMNPIANRERMLRLIFDFGVPAVSVQVQDVLALLGATGQRTGCVVHSGETQTRVVPIHEGSVIPHAITHCQVTGRDLTDFLQQLLIKRGYAEQLEVTAMKETLCAVALDFEEEMQLQAAIEKTYQRADGGLVTIEHERFR